MAELTYSRDFQWKEIARIVNLIRHRVGALDVETITSQEAQALVVETLDLAMRVARFRILSEVSES